MVLASTGLAVELFEAVEDAVLRPEKTGMTVGLEVEAFPMGSTGERLLVDQTAGRLTRGLTPRDDGIDPHLTAEGAAVTFEPGGQLEVATRPATISGAIDAQLRAWKRLDELLGARLVFTGVDLWNDVYSVPLQLRAPRYRAMDGFFSIGSGWGRLMMRHTASVQINLDGGDRWFGHRVRVAQALAPFITASFAASPVWSVPSGRALVWQSIDHTRTGFLDFSDDPAKGVWEKARAANVLLFCHRGTWERGAPGYTLETWIRHGHPRWGRPDPDDVRYHLTTLFPEVRPRHGTLEIRTPDSLPLRFLPALVALVSGAVYDRSAGHEILELTAGNDLTDLWRRAARWGLQDPALAGPASRVWNIALEAARSSTLRISTVHRDDAAEYVERYVHAARCPSDVLLETLARDPREALVWAGLISEP